MSESPIEVKTSIALPEFRRFLGFRFLLTFSMQMQAVVVSWQVYEFTKDPLSLGLMGLAEAVPYICTALFGGHTADRIDRRRITLVCTAVYVVCSFALLGITEFVDGTTPHIEYLFYGVIFITGIARGFIAPAISALFAQVLPRRLYPNGAVWSTNVWHTAAVAGPAAGGLVFGFAGVLAAYWVVIAVSIGALLAIYLLPSYGLPPRSGPDESMFASIGQGLRFVFSNQIIVAALGLDLVAVLFGGAVAVLPIFASEILHTGPEGLGFLRAAPFIGSIVMGLWLARPGVSLQNAGRDMLLSVAGFGASMIVFAVSTNYALSFSMLFLSGVFDTISVIVRSTILQLLMPDHMRGRVSAVNSIFIGTSNEIGAFESGLAARLMGLVPSVVFGGGVSVLVTMAAAVASPQLRRLNMRDLMHAKEESQQ